MKILKEASVIGVFRQTLPYISLEFTRMLVMFNTQRAGSYKKNFYFSICEHSFHQYISNCV